MDIIGDQLKQLTEGFMNIQATQQEKDGKKFKAGLKSRSSTIEWTRQNEFALLDALLNEQSDKYKAVAASKQEIDRKIQDIQNEFQRSKMLSDMFIKVFDKEIIFTFSQAVQGFKNAPQLNMNVIYSAIQCPGQFTFPLVKNIQFWNTVSLKTLSGCLQNFYQMVSNCIQFVSLDDTFPQHIMQILCGNASSTDAFTQVTIHCQPKGGDVAKMNGREIHVNLYSISYYAEMFLTLWVLYHVQHYGFKQAVLVVLTVMKMMETLPNHPYYYKLVSNQLGITSDVVEQIHFCGCLLKEAIKTHENQQN